MKLLLVETMAYAPVSPLFKESCEALARKDASFHWKLFDDGQYSWTWNFEYRLLNVASQCRPDVVLFVKGPLATPDCLQRLKQYAGKLVCWQPDDPWNHAACPHERVKECIPYYDLYATCKTAVMDDLVKAGAQKVIYVPCGYKPEIHFIEDLNVDYHTEQFTCDVAVIGGADQERIGIVKNLVKALPDLSLKLYGGYWDRDDELVQYAKGHVYGWRYRAAIRNAKVVLNILRSANRDQHNMRTFEIPACGGIVVTKRTAEHDAIYGYAYSKYTEDYQIPLAIKETLECIGTPKGLVEVTTETQVNNIKDCTWNARLDQMLKALCE